MDSSKYEFCSETSSPAHSSDELCVSLPPSAASSVSHHQHRQSLSSSASRSCSTQSQLQSQLLMTTNSANSGSSTAAMEREINCSLSKQQRINECLRAAAAAAAGHGAPGRDGSSETGQGSTSSNSSCHNFMAQYERNLNFATVQLDDSEYGFPKKKTVRDPLSHRIIEKRRRDRMNNCLADLARLLPQASLRKGRGRIEKTEIVELAIKHLQHLQTHPCPHGDNCEYSPLVRKGLMVVSSQSGPSSPSQCGGGSLSDRTNNHKSSSNTLTIDQEYAEQRYQQGYQECMNETMHFLVDRKGIYPGDSLCLQLVKHLAEKLNMRNAAIGKVELCDSVDTNASLISCGGHGRSSLPCGGGGGGSCSNSGDERGSDSHCDRQCPSEDKHHHYHSSCSSKYPCDDHDVLMMDHESSEPRTTVRGGRTEKCSSAAMDVEAVYDIEQDDHGGCSSPAPLTIVEHGTTPTTTTTVSNNGSSSSTSTASDSPINGNRNANGGGRASTPLIPTIICTNSGSPAATHRESPGLHNNSCTDSNQHSPNESADEGSCASTDRDHLNRYKFKTNIKQRFTAEVSPVAAPRGDSLGIAAIPGHSQFRSSNNSSRNSHAADETDEHEHEHEDTCGGHNEEVMTAMKQQQPQQHVSSQGGEVSRPKSPTPFVSVVKMSTLIESDDESCSVVAEVDAQRKLYANAHAKEDDKLKPTMDTSSDPINLSKSATSATLPACPTQVEPPSRAGNTSVARLDKGVPVFALSEQGQFYIPLTIHKSILEPFSRELDELDNAKLMGKLPLYPVTISVCFAPKCKNQTVKLQGQGQQQPLALAKELKLHRKDEPSAAAVHESKLGQVLTGRIPPLTASSTIPDFKTICEIERRKQQQSGLSNYSIPDGKHMPGKWPQAFERHSPESDVIYSHSYPRTLDDACGRVSRRERERETHDREQPETNTSSVGSIPFSTPNYLYPILLGACTPKIYQSRTAGASSASGSGGGATRSTSCHVRERSSPSPSPASSHHAQQRSSTSCSTSPIPRKRCNPSASVSPPPTHGHRSSGWRESYISGAAASEFHRPATIDMTMSGAADNNGNSCSSRNSSPGSNNSHCGDSHSYMSKYAQFLEAQQFWNSSAGAGAAAAALAAAGAGSGLSGAGDSELLKHTLQRGHRSSGREYEGANSARLSRSISPKRQRKDESEAYQIQIPKIITLK